ncbi:hypothetical protein vseg_000309 [Gypsophila vaccaria]
MVKIPSEEERKSVREFFGITKSLDIFKPIPCNTFINLVKIYSLLPDQENNPFAKYTNDPDYAHTYPWPEWILTHRNDSVGQSADKDGVRDNSVPRRNTEASNGSVHSSSLEVGESSGQNGTNSDMTSGTLCKDAVLNGPEMANDGLGMSKNSEMLDKTAYVEDGTTAEAIRVSNVQEDLSSIQRILMDESDDPDMLQLLDKDVNMDFASDFGSILDMDRSHDVCLTMESIDNEKFTAVDETKRRGVEGDRSTSESNVGISQAQKSVDSGMPSGPEFVNQNVRSPKDARKSDTMLCEKNVPQELSEIGGLPSIRRESELVGKFSIGKSDDNLGKRNRVTVCGLAKGKRSKLKIAKTKSGKNVESGKHKHSYIENEAYNHMRSGGDDLMVHGKTVQQNALTTSSSPSTKELLQDKESGPKGHKRVRYTREELLNLGKTASVPEHIKKAARQIGVEIHEKEQISAAFKVADSGILKKTRGGSVSEAKKEKKKMKKRKKRAELNRQLGVKRLKLQPIVKPKVVQHCRHYLMGRCYEGEKCKFSHDVVPLTKSKPCCHFARQACMKGDQCPFDHELSKYPCNSFADTGFCSRGESCLFSHKIPVKPASEPSTVPMKCDTSSVDQHDKSKSKQQANTVPSTSGKATLKNLKETLTTQTTKPAIRPKGLSFYSSGTSHLDDSAQPKESDMSAQDSRNMPLNIPGSGIQGIHHPFFKKTPFDSSRHHSSGKPLLNDSSIYQLKQTSGRSDHTVGTPTPIDALNVTESLPTPTPSPERAMHSGSPTLIPAPTLNLSEALKGIQTTTLLPERAFNVPIISKAPSLNPERASNLSEFRKGNPTPNPTPTPTPTLKRAPKLSEMRKGTSIPTLSPTATPTPTSERALNLSQMLKGTLTSTTAATLTPTPERTLNLSEMLKGTPTSTPTPAATATPTPERALNLSELLKSALTQAKAKGIGVSSVNVPATNISHGKSGSVVTTEQEKGNINASEKLKEVQLEPGRCGSQSSSSKFSSKVDLPLKNRLNNSQRALQSALAFASKHESRIKTSSVTATKENNLNDVTSCSSVKQSEPLQASKILQFLNRQGDKENK